MSLLPMPNADYLNALATACEAVQRLYIPPPHGHPAYQVPHYQSGSSLPTYHGPTPSLLPYATTAGPHQLYQSSASACYQRELAEMMKENRPPSYFGYQQTCPPLHRPPSLPYYSDHRSITPVPASPLTPPPTPESSHSPAYAPAPSAPRSEQPPNPVLRNIAAYAEFQRYLDETWPEESMRRGSAIIRASLYGRIAEVLRGGQGTTRFKNWVKKSEFFLVERIQPGMGYGACLAIPVGRSHTASRKGGSGGGGKAVSVHGGYKLVARLEDFVHIIGAYHNDQKGHHGIRRTYAMVQEEFSYVPRTAVAKYIELCNICSLHRRKGKSMPTKDTNIPTADVERVRTVKGPSSCQERDETEVVTPDLPTGHELVITPPESRPCSQAIGRIQAVESVEELGLVLDLTSREAA